MQLASIADGPRGRRFLFELLAQEDEQLATAVTRESMALGVSDGSAHVYSYRIDDGEPSRADFAPVTQASIAQRIRDQEAASADADMLMALTMTTINARYWQEADERDQVLGRPEIREVLAEVARALEPTLSASWLAESLDRANQFFVRWLGEHSGPELEMSGADAKLRAWKRGTIADEVRADAERPENPAAPWSGAWWSTPALAGLPITTRGLPETGPVRLQLLEDTLGWTEALVMPVRARDGVKVYELATPDAWTQLVGRYPLRVTNSPPRLVACDRDRVGVVHSRLGGRRGGLRRGAPLGHRVSGDCRPCADG